MLKATQIVRNLLSKIPYLLNIRQKLIKVPCSPNAHKVCKIQSLKPKGEYFAPKSQNFSLKPEI